MTIVLDDEAKHYLASIGYSPIYGARPLNRAIQSELLNPLSVLILQNAVLDGEVVNVKFDGPHNRLKIIPNHRVTSQVTHDMEIDDEDDIDIVEMD